MKIELNNEEIKDLRFCLIEGIDKQLRDLDEYMQQCKYEGRDLDGEDVEYTKLYYGDIVKNLEHLLTKLED